LKEFFVGCQKHLTELFVFRHGDVTKLNAGDALENSLQCFDAVGWAAGRASGL